MRHAAKYTLLCLVLSGNLYYKYDYGAVINSAMLVMTKHSGTNSIPLVKREQP